MRQVSDTGDQDHKDYKEITPTGRKGSSVEAVQGPLVRGYVHEGRLQSLRRNMYA